MVASDAADGHLLSIRSHVAVSSVQTKSVLLEEEMKTLYSILEQSVVGSQTLQQSSFIRTLENADSTFELSCNSLQNLYVLINMENIFVVWK